MRKLSPSISFGCNFIKGDRLFSSSICKSSSYSGLTNHGIAISMSCKGNPHDNAKVESFMKTLKTEEVYLNEYATEAEAREDIGAFIETIYNVKRLHSSLGYSSRHEFEEHFYSHKAA